MAGWLSSLCPRGVVLVGVLLAGLTGCATGRNTVTGSITPGHFEFTQVLEEPGPENEAGGWWAVCIHARINMGDSGATSICKFEVGIPVRTRLQGEISLEDAQEAAATMANRAMYRVLSAADVTVMLGTLCTDFKKLYKLMLDEKRKGSRVRQCMMKDVKIIHFDEPYHCDF
jgi:hypothetical protein